MLDMTFNVNDYYSNGSGIIEEGIFINFGENENYSLFRIKIGKELKDIDMFIEKLQNMKKEIIRNYPDVR